MKIKVISESPHYKALLNKIEEAVKGVELGDLFVQKVAQLSEAAENIHLAGFFSSLHYALEKGVVELDGDIIVFKVPVHSFELPCETMGVFKAAEADDAVFLPPYLAAMLLRRQVEKALIGAYAARDVVIDDEHVCHFYLFNMGEEWWVLKEHLHYDPPSLRIYDCFEDAVVDFRTVDYGWENWSPLQAQLLPVVPRKRLELNQLLLDALWNTGRMSPATLRDVVEGRWKEKRITLPSYTFKSLPKDYYDFGDELLDRVFERIFYTGPEPVKASAFLMELEAKLAPLQKRKQELEKKLEALMVGWEGPPFMAKVSVGKDLKLIHRESTQRGPIVLGIPIDEDVVVLEAEKRPSKSREGGYYWVAKKWLRPEQVEAEREQIKSEIQKVEGEMRQIGKVIKDG